MTEMQVTPPFRLAYVPGVTPAKWIRVWEERLPDVPLDLVAVPAAEGEPTLRAEAADAGLVRLPVDRTGMSAIPLYTETTVVVFPKDHWLAAAEEVDPADLAEEIVLHPLDDTLDWAALPGLPAFERPATTADAIELVAAGIGVLFVPQSLARLHHRRDLTYRTAAAEVPQSQVALAWLEERTTDLVEEFIGIVRGRTVNSSRGRGAQPAQKPAEKPTAGGSRTGGAKAAGGKTAGGKTGGTKAGGSRTGGAKKGAAKAGGAKAGGRPRGASGGRSGRRS